MYAKFQPERPRDSKVIHSQETLLFTLVINVSVCYHIATRNGYQILGFTYSIKTNNISLCSSMKDLYACKVSAGKTS